MVDSLRDYITFKKKAWYLKKAHCAHCTGNLQGGLKYVSIEHVAKMQRARKRTKQGKRNRDKERRIEGKMKGNGGFR